MKFLSKIIEVLQKRSLPKAVVWIVSALIIGATFAEKMARSGDTDKIFILAMSLAAIVATVMVAPGPFSGEQRDAGDWSKEIKALRERKTPPVSEDDGGVSKDSDEKFSSEL